MRPPRIVVNGSDADQFGPPPPDRIRKILTIVMKDFDRLHANGKTTYATVVRADSLYSVAVTAALAHVADTIDTGLNPSSLKRVLAGKENGKRGGRPPKITEADIPQLKEFFEVVSVSFLGGGKILTVNEYNGQSILTADERRDFARWRRERGTP